MKNRKSFSFWIGNIYELIDVEDVEGVIFKGGSR